MLTALFKQSVFAKIGMLNSYIDFEKEGKRMNKIDLDMVRVIEEVVK